MATVFGYVQTAGPVTKPKRDGTTFVLNEVTIDGQVYVARKDVCNVAAGFLGQHVEAVVRAEQKGNYTNYYLDFIQLAGGGAQPGQAAYVTQAQHAQQQTQPQPIPPPASPPPVVAPVHPVAPQHVQPVSIPITPDPFEERKTLSIHRQTAAKVAGVLGGSPIDFWANVQALVEFFQSGNTPLGAGAQFAQQVVAESRPNGAAYQPFQDTPQPVGNQFVPAGYADPGSPLPPPTDDDIPF